MKDFNRVTAQEAILQALATIRDPDLGRDIVSLGLIKDLKVSGENISFSVELTTPACPARYQTKEEARRVVLSLPGIKNVDVTMTSKVRRPVSEETDKLLPLLKNIVLSGMGGVGKSTVRNEVGNRSFEAWRPVGLMDADVYGRAFPQPMPKSCGIPLGTRARCLKRRSSSPE
jgi:ATP-binding protein involved in chromosome partitioning